MTSISPRMRSAGSKRCGKVSRTSSRSSASALPPENSSGSVPELGALEVRAHAGRPVPVLIDDAPVLENQRALALVRWRRRAHRDAHADADTDAPAAAADPRAAEANADARAGLHRGLRHPGVPVASIGRLGAARGRAPGAQHVFVGGSLPGISRLLDILRGGAGREDRGERHRGVLASIADARLRAW